MPATALERRKKIQRMRVAMAVTIYSYVYRLKSPARTSIRACKIFASEFLHGHPQRVLETLRMLITTFLDLRGWPSERSLLRSTRGISIKEQLMILCIVDHNSSNREAQDEFQHNGETVSRHFHSVLNALLPLYKVFVRTPLDSAPAYCQ